MPGAADVIEGEHALNGSSSDPVTVSDAGPSDAVEWNAFLQNSQSGSFYHDYRWREVNERLLGHRGLFLVARRQGAIRGLLPLVFVRSRLFGRILCSMPFVNFGGPIALDGDTLQALVTTALSLSSDRNADYLELRSAQELSVELPASLHKVSMTITLDPDPDTLWQGFRSKHRTQIRRAYKDGLSVICGHGELLDAYYDLYSAAWRDLGTPVYSKRYFRGILEAFPDETRIFVVQHRGHPVATAFNGYHRDTVEGMWAAVHPQARRLNPNYVLYWEMIRDACERGFGTYHLGRSTAGSGAEQFKEKWNASVQQLYWYYYMPDGGAMPSLNVDNPKYALAIKAWRRLPLAATRLIGPALARCIP